MFFFAFWGKKVTESQLGFAADFCPVCRRISAFVINRVGVASHIYFIAVNDGSFLGHTQRCLSCQTISGSNPDRFACLAKTNGSSIEGLASETFPAIQAVFSERLALEDIIRENPHLLDPASREHLLLEAFAIAAPYFHNRAVEGFNLLVTALRPLDPSEDEVRACLEHFRGTRARIGRKLSTAAVLKNIRHKPSAHEYDY